MLRNAFIFPALCIAMAIEFVIAAVLLDNQAVAAMLPAYAGTKMLIAGHFLASLLSAFCISILLLKLVPGRRIYFVLMLFLLSLFVPFFGAFGAWLSITFGAIMAHHRHQENIFWQYTGNVDLPFSAPIDRPHPNLDGRGYIEQLAFDGDTETLYNKVIASRHIRDSQSAPILKSAVGHSNERIRLLAYLMLDKKVNRLNKEIQRLESDARAANGYSKANIHLQIADNYWELLTLEGDEPVAREQLLRNAAQHTVEAIEAHPNNNGYFLLGKIYLKQGENAASIAAFEQSIDLGMPKDKVIPYLAETAFIARDFQKLRSVMSQLDPAFKSYPPLSHVAEFWA